MKVRGRKEVLQGLKDKPNSVFAEAVRNLRTSILMSNPDKEPQVILVTSSVPGEGKTTLSLALARYFGSLEGRRVLLVEADIRRQTLRAYVDNDREKGVQLMDVVLGKSRLDDVDLFDSNLGLEVLRGSGGEFNAADLFESRRFKDLITDLRDRYHHIIIDSPPVLAVPDARVLTRYCDLSVFAVRWNSTSRMQVRQGLEMLNSVGQPADGGGIDPSRPSQDEDLRLRRAIRLRRHSIRVLRQRVNSARQRRKIRLSRGVCAIARRVDQIGASLSHGCVRFAPSPDFSVVSLD